MMFEIAGDDIALLNDRDLRAVIARLCEAELAKLGFPPTCVTWGGNQTAADGGLDVRVKLEIESNIKGFIPKATTGYQVKKSDMPSSEITKEMKPNGKLRPVIAELVKRNGCYIIVSSNGSVSDSALKDRIKAMRDALKGVKGSRNIHLDFYDRNRIATSLRNHPALIPYVRSCIGKSITGWKSFEAWSMPPAGKDDSFLFDTESRIKIGIANDSDGLSVEAGIQLLRETLQTPGKSVRLVGLSGVGKTRLCEAIFDASIGNNALDPSLAIYTNLADAPDPAPISLAANLAAKNNRAILIIDNCTPELHRQLSDTIKAAGSQLSLLTVEYDIREDQPEGTDVFTLDNSSITVIEKLVERRNPKISQVNRQRIAEFSGGNARVALALASSLEHTDSLAALTDTELFRRLFNQHHDDDAKLFEIAQVCSLLYSFDGETFQEAENELSTIASLANCSSNEVHRSCAELARRDLIQKRGIWRAILPHAIANRLAALALQNLPRQHVLQHLVTESTPRLCRSFARRLGYLHESQEAQIIAQQWLSEGGMLRNVADLNDDGRTIFKNVAPVNPEAALDALVLAFEDASDEILQNNKWVVPLLHLLAYDSAMFEKATNCLVHFALGDFDQNTNQKSEAVQHLETLYQAYLSGTHASVEQRTGILKPILMAAEQKKSDLGIKLLDSLLQGSHFTSFYQFEFGARSRDYGFHPRTKQEAQHWYETALTLAVEIAVSETPSSQGSRSVIAKSLRSLWRIAGIDVTLDEISRRLAADQFWLEGWKATREALNYDKTHMKASSLARLQTLEKFLRPDSLVEQVLSLIHANYGDDLEGDEITGESLAVASERHRLKLEELGKQLAEDDKAFLELVPELLTAQYYNVSILSQSLGRNTNDPENIWATLLQNFANTEKSNVYAMGSFIFGVGSKNRILADRFLDQAVDGELIAAQFPHLQAISGVDSRAVQRLLHALRSGIAPISQYGTLAGGRAADRLSGRELASLLTTIADIDGGVAVAIEILAMRLFSDSHEKRKSASELVEAGKYMLARVKFDRENENLKKESHLIDSVVEFSLQGLVGVPLAQRITLDLMAALNDYSTSAHSRQGLFASLLRIQPTATLDVMFGGDEVSRNKAARSFYDLKKYKKNPLDDVPVGTIIGWCEVDPEIRFPLFTSLAKLFGRPSDQSAYQWNDICTELLACAPDKNAVFDEVISQLRPMSWSGSYATKLEMRLALLKKLSISSYPMLQSAYDQAINDMQTDIDTETKREKEASNTRDLRFED